jgi:biotin carboxyl carrier protein
VVVEAMKMENEVLAPGSGTVVSLEVAPGQTVEKGALLFSME